MPASGPAWVDAHAPWTRAERDRCTFIRWMVIHGRMSDGEDTTQLQKSGKLKHRFMPYLRTWSKAMVAAHEDRRG